MKLAALYTGEGERTSLHLLVGEKYVAVDRLVDEGSRLHGLADVGALFALGDDALEEVRSLEAAAAGLDGATAVRLAPPVTRPSKIVCVGLNYLAHIEETNNVKPERIVLFSKYPSSLVGDGAEVRRPAITSKLDYEGELAVVIGRRTRAVSVADALSTIGGFTIINDVSARDLQSAEGQWVRGKALDTFAPLGPVVLDAASVPEIGDLRIVTRVNGEVRQNDLCSLMITPVAELVSYISAYITLEPGDIIATGTPQGVASGMDTPVYLEPGDEMSVTIEEIGVLHSRVAG